MSPIVYPAKRSPAPLWLPYLLALLVLGAYTAAFAWGAQRPGGARAFAVLGTSNTPGNRGYDGQYYYRIATAPLGGRHGLDRPAYRYERIGYPLLAWLLAFGRRDRVAAVLVWINVLAIGLGTLLLALLLRRHGLFPLYALAWPAYAGQVGAFWRDLAEPLAFGLLVAALLVWRPTRVWPAALLLLAAALTKETALLFAVAALAHLVLRRRQHFWSMVLLVVVPYAAWQVLLWLLLGQTGVASADHPPRLPLGGLAGVRTASQLFNTLLVVVAPAVLCLGLALWSMRLSARSPGAPPSADRLERFVYLAGDLPTLALLANVAFVIWLPARSYADLWASARNADGMVLAALTHPLLAAMPRLRRLLFALWACGSPLLWLH